MSRSAPVKLFYGFAFASRCYFYLPILVLWFLRHGFTQLQVMLLISIYFVSALSAELPTGLFADRVGRKWAMVCGSLGEALGVACLMFAADWWFAVVGEACLGVGQAFHTGAKEAYLYDHLKEHGMAVQYQSRYAEAKFFEFVAMSVGAACGAPLYLLDGRYPFAASAAIFAVGALLAGCLTEPPRRLPPSTDAYESAATPAVRVARAGWVDLRHGWHEIRGGPTALRRLIGYYAWFFSLVLIFTVTLSQPYLTWIHFPLKLFGWAYLYFNTVAMAGTIFANRLAGRLMGGRFFLALGLLFAATLLILAHVREALLFLLMGAIYLGWGLLLPTVSYAVNRLVSSERRATVLSIQDFFQSGVFVVTAIGIGYVTDRWGLPFALTILSCVSLGVVGITIGMARAEEKRIGK